MSGRQGTGHVRSGQRWTGRVRSGQVGSESDGIKRDGIARHIRHRLCYNEAEQNDPWEAVLV